MRRMVYFEQKYSPKPYLQTNGIFLHMWSDLWTNSRPKETKKRKFKLSLFLAWDIHMKVFGQHTTTYILPGQNMPHQTGKNGYFSTKQGPSGTKP